MRGHRDLRLAATLAVICAIGALIVPLGAVRVVFAIPLTLFLPGYAITAAVQTRWRVGWPELLPLSLGIGLSWLALGGILLNYTPAGLQAIPWLVLLLATVLLGCWIAARRRPAAKRVRAPVVPRVGPGTALLLAGCAAMTAAALILAQTTLHAGRAFGYTALWMAPAGQSGGSVRIGVTSEQQDATAYRLRVDLDDRPKPVVRSFSLNPGESRTLTLEPGSATAGVQVEATLFKRGHPHTPYRRVFGQVPGEGGRR